MSQIVPTLTFTFQAESACLLYFSLLQNYFDNMMDLEILQPGKMILIAFLTAVCPIKRKIRKGDGSLGSFVSAEGYLIGGILLLDSVFWSHLEKMKASVDGHMLNQQVWSGLADHGWAGEHEESSFTVWRTRQGIIYPVRPGLVILSSGCFNLKS